MKFRAHLRVILAVFRCLPKRRHEQFFIIIVMMLMSAIEDLVVQGAILTLIIVMTNSVDFFEEKSAGLAAGSPGRAVRSKPFRNTA